jgi:membrane protein implicated in regulation of membrane protease activity
MKSKRPWWQVTTSLRLALIIGGGYLIAGLGGLAFWLASGKIWLAVGWGFYFLCGTPWYITAIVLLKQRHSATSNQH